MDLSLPELGPPGIAKASTDADSVFTFGRKKIRQSLAVFGKRQQKIGGRWRGKYYCARAAGNSSNDLALDATLRAMAGRSLCAAGVAKVNPQDLREKVRRHRSHYNVVFILDNSWSVQVQTTIERTKAVVFDLLKKAKVYREKVALVTFRQSRNPVAGVWMPFTRSYSHAVRRLRDIPISGATPLPDGIRKAWHLLDQERNKCDNGVPVAIIVTDGLANIPLRPGGDPHNDLTVLCRHLRREGVLTAIVDTELSQSRAIGNRCREMASLSGGKYLRLSNLTPRAMEAIFSHTPRGENG